jgi:MFS transporter, CP family, cyanate transporter
MTIPVDELIDAEAESRPAPEVTPVLGGRWLLGTSLVLIALNLRAIFSSASALLPEISRIVGLDSSSAGFLTTLPVLCLGAFAPLAPRLARRWGAERVLLLVLLLIGVGTALRFVPQIAPLFIGTALAGAGIAMGNVLLPGVVKRDFADKAASMTGLYSMALCASAALGSGLTVPLEHALGGSAMLALAVWAVPAFAVALIWAPQAMRARHQAQQAGRRVVGLWRDRRAWQVTLFMGLQSAMAYAIFGWLQPMLRERGLDAVAAGGVVSLSVLVQALACLVAPQLAVRRRNQSALAMALCGIATIGFLGLVFAPLDTALVWAALQGLGQGGLIAVALTIIVLRSRDPAVAAELSGMAQCVGYLLAALGPLVMGLLRGASGGFAAGAVFFVVLGLGAAGFGWLAGRSGHVEAETIDVSASRRA